MSETKDGVRQVFTKRFDKTKKIKTSFFAKAHKALETFSLTEKIIFYFLSTVMILSSLFLALTVNGQFLVEVPENGGIITEGIIGSPKFVNPVLAVTEADKDLTSLVYSGLLSTTPEGTLQNDLAQSYTVSDDGLTYDFILKDNIYFHDNEPVTTDDVEFTVQKVQDPAIRSPKKANWEGVKIEKVSPKEIKFILSRPYAFFPMVNATMKIIPKHIWKNADADQFTLSQLYVTPIGSGPYKVKSVKKNSVGIPTYYELESFNHYALGEPFIKKVAFKFYNNENDLVDAFKNGAIDSANSISPDKVNDIAKTGAEIKTVPLPRIFGVFFNQNQAPLFTNKEVRQALDLATDKNRIVNEVLYGYGTAIGSPIPPGSITDIPEETGVADIEKAKSLLDKNGWKANSQGILEKTVKKQTFTLSFSISTSDAADLIKTANILKEDWAKIGAVVDVKVFEGGDLNQNIIRPRKYDALLFGEVVGRDLDFYPFWHSSQRNDPGLNIALYTNQTVDKLLDDAKKTTDDKARLEIYKKFDQELRNDVPAVFLYSPDLIYAIPKSVKNIDLGKLAGNPSERFLGIKDWFIDTNKVWSIFTKE